MPNINYEITLNNTPYYDTLLQELIEVTHSKRKLYRRLKTNDDYYTKLTYEERELLMHLTEKENKILFEIICLKGWAADFDPPDFSGKKDNEEDFDKYAVNF